MQNSIYRVVQHAYNQLLRPHLPRKIGVYNGIPVRGPRLFDMTDVIPNHEHGLVEATHDCLSPGDSVVIIGGGMGTSVVHAATAVGPAGSVTVYEASREMYACLTATLDINDCQHVEAHHAVVGEPGDIWGDLGDPAHIPATDLPSCDVLQLDCEGAELDILQAIPAANVPASVVVETHGVYGAPTDAVCEVLTDHGYRVNQIRDHQPASNTHREQDIFVVDAHLAQAESHERADIDRSQEVAVDG